MKKKISKATLERMPYYYSTLKKIEDDSTGNRTVFLGEKIISSNELAEKLGFSPEQVRKDIAELGQFGVKGAGYRFDMLRRAMEKVLGLQYRWYVAIFGAGHLGSALTYSDDFQRLGFTVTALFDVAENLIGKKINDVKVYNFADLNSVAKRKLIDIGVITVPEDSAQIVADSLIQAGINGIWNFTATKLTVPQEVAVVNENLSMSLINISCRLAGSN